MQELEVNNIIIKDGYENRYFRCDLPTKKILLRQLSTFQNWANCISNYQL